MAEDYLRMDDEPAASRRLTPTTGLLRESDVPGSANEDFLFHLYRGSELLQDNRVHEAKEELEQALHLQPRDAKGQDLLAVVYFRLGLYPRAIHIYEQLRKKNTSDTALLLNLALCYLKTGQPQLARRDLEQLLDLNPHHARAWGYLGLACERLGDLVNAERAFEHGGHHQMAKRIAARVRASIPPEAPTPSFAPEPSHGTNPEVRAVLGAAYEELDAGELSFSLAAPASEKELANPVKAQSWRPVELGQELETGRATRMPAAHEAAFGTAHLPQLGVQPSAANRRPTLIAPVGAPPAQAELLGQFRIPSASPPSFTLDEAGTPSFPVRRAVVPVPSPYGARPEVDVPMRGATLQPPSVEILPTAPPVSAPESSLRFPSRGAVLHPTGLALVRTTAESGFTTRLEAIRGQQPLSREGGLVLGRLERRVKGESTGEVFGTLTSPFVGATGEGHLLLGGRPGRRLHLVPVAGGEMCFVREEVLLGFDGGLAFENGRLQAGESEQLAIVQLRGEGDVFLETLGEVLTMNVEADRGLTVRREVVLGWLGRLVPRVLAPADAPLGQRGLVGFAGEGRVLLSAT